MDTRGIRKIAALGVLVTAFIFSGCATTQAPAESPGGTSPTPADSAIGQTPESSPSNSGEVGSGCWVHLFDAENFNEADGHFKLTEAGRYGNLLGLPGANQDWTDEADSIKVGPDATVTIWSGADFTGTSTQLDPGSSHPNIPEPWSLEMVCR